MIRFFLISCAAGCAGLVWCQPQAPASSMSCRPAGAATAQYMRSGPDAAWSSCIGGSSRAVLPKSTHADRPGALGRCSVENLNPPATCSATSSGANGECSAEVDRNEFCSAFWSPGNPGTTARCSVQSANNSRCSVGRVRPGGTPNPSECSASGGAAGSVTTCSILLSGPTGQFCSSDNMGAQANRCSAVDGSGGAVQCSVLGTPSTNRCSVSGNGGGTDTCSVYLSNTFCSILQPNTGAQCTAFNGAQAGQCSANGIGNAQCSVLGGGGPQGGICR